MWNVKEVLFSIIDEAFQQQGELRKHDVIQMSNNSERVEQNCNHTSPYTYEQVYKVGEKPPSLNIPEDFENVSARAKNCWVCEYQKYYPSFTITN